MKLLLMENFKTHQKISFSFYPRRLFCFQQGLRRRSTDLYQSYHQNQTLGKKINVGTMFFVFNNNNNMLQYQNTSFEVLILR